jgi:hypothetical protein
VRSGAERSRWTPVVVRALLYALAVTALVLWLPGDEHVFIYQGF